MSGVLWDFADEAPEDLDAFVAQVSSNQSDTAKWDPNESIGSVGFVYVDFVQFWRADSTALTRISLNLTNDQPWTAGKLLHALHHELKKNVEHSDSVFFEGLAPLGPGQYRLFLGS